MTDDNHPASAESETGTVVAFPMREFIDEGLLHYFNATVFWPLGIMLTASRWNDEGEAYRSTILPKIAAAFDAAFLELSTWVNHGGDNDDGKGDPLRDRAIEAVWQAFSADIKGSALEALTLRQYSPPDTIVTALEPDEAAARRSRAEAWIQRRKTALDETIRS